MNALPARSSNWLEIDALARGFRPSISSRSRIRPTRSMQDIELAQGGDPASISTVTGSRNYAGSSLPASKIPENEVIEETMFVSIPKPCGCRTGIRGLS